MGRDDDAREMYREGVEAAARKGDGHAQRKCRRALDLLDLNMSAALYNR